MKITNLFLTASVSILLFASCKKASTNSSGIEYQIKTTNTISTVNRVDAGSLQWTSGFASASQIKLEGKSSGSEVEFKANNVQHVDLFASVAATLGNVTLPAGTYTEVEFKIELNPNGNDPALELDGTFTNSVGVAKPVVFKVNSLLEIKAEQNNVTVDNSNTTALTTLDLSLLTGGISQALLNAATVTNGTIVISSSSNTNLYNIIIANFNLHHEAEIGHH